MLIVIFASLLLIALTTVVHYEALRMIYVALPSLAIPTRTKILVVIFGTLAAHFLEIGIYGIALYILVHYLGVGSLNGATQSFETYLIFSAETYTSLGLGDVKPVGPLRLLAGVEALNGLLLIGWSASFAYIEMERFWSTKSVNDRS